MKLNGKEIDMKKVVEVHEKENKIKNVPKCANRNTNSYMSKWFNETEGGAILREKLRERCKTNPPKQKIKYKLTELDTGDIYYIEGTAELAKFLGYKSANSQIRNSEIVHTIKNENKKFKKEII